MSTGDLGRTYNDGDVIIRQGDVGDCMYVIQEGQVEIVSRSTGQDVRLAVRGKGEFVGEMALFDSEVRSADVRALGSARLLTVDRKNLMSRVHEDPSLAYRLLQTLTRRVRELSDEVARLKGKAGG